MDMTRFLHVAGLSLLLALVPFQDASAEQDYAEIRNALRQAMADGEHAQALEHLEAALALRPEAPWLLGTLATVQVRLGLNEAALDTVARLTDLGVRVDVSGHPAFGGVRALEDWPDVQARQSALDEPVGEAEVAARLDAATFVPEGVAVDEQGRVYLGSIRHGRIVRIDDTGAETVVETGTLGLGSVFGMRIDDEAGLLWVSTAVVPQGADPDVERMGRSGILRFRLETGEPVDAFWLPGDDADHILGDLVLLDAHRAVATDSLTGAVVELDVRTGEFTPLLEPGRLSSPQGLVHDPDHDAWFISDWARGLFRLDTDDGTLERLHAADGVMIYGIDGLYAYEGDLIAVQNLARPHRLTRLKLDASGRAVTAQDTLLRAHPDFDEPTLGAVHHGVFYLNANSHWNRFDADNDLSEPGALTGPIVLRVPLER